MPNNKQIDYSAMCIWVKVHNSISPKVNGSDTIEDIVNHYISLF